MEYYSAIKKNKFESVLMRCMKLQPIIQSEVNQKEKYYIVLYTMEYYSAIKKNTFESVLMRWMKLQPIIESEVNQKEKYQYSILTHIYGI